MDLAKNKRDVEQHLVFSLRSPQQTLGCHVARVV